MPSALKMIIVDDSEDDAEFIQEEIKKAGYELTATRVDSADALQAALAQGDWDLVLVRSFDAGIQCLCGLEGARRKRHGHPVYHRLRGHWRGTGRGPDAVGCS